MSSSILHQCPHCGHTSDISNSLAAFIENPHCKQCGLSASESDQKMQDDLADLFDRQMTMAQLHDPNKDELTSPSLAPPISYSITQHYHHSAHKVTPNVPIQASIDVLRHYGLDPSTMTPSQLNLFDNADTEQRERLIQTWQLYSQLSQNTQDHAMHDYVMDDSQDGNPDAEPYMISGYETIATGVAHSLPSNLSNALSDDLPKEPTTGEPYTGSKDPVYQGQQWWELTNAGPMESHYGAFEQMRRYSGYT
ncbi:uncharacterized protein N7446_002848 [Penicillium canescens]|uniref:Uncharacterized protein n=1 Tax=Penicillium canescens TaxID=5083 RepID=A0AAD6IGM8_PENCN|nr:uncharacterized protein N7446_002848 [Penicillium canescens]KAJ6044654.1 hypothetical protein N7460_006009 [Penicillium canescens]KAJ6056124.1 hypothetical protein N7444_005222 [Penicillium canescens]KAJ6075071.1 hypothetical protein N7446_002848 [Penicillium canescens]